MGIFKPFRTGQEINLIDKFLEVKEDLLKNREELPYRYEYYTKKYRGNRLTDINVGLFKEDGLSHNLVTQIFIRNKEGYVRNQITLSSKGRILNDNLKVEING